MTSTYSEESLKPLNKPQLIKFLLDLKHQSNESINMPTDEMELLNKNFSKFESEVIRI